jgi:hypothetical protein
MSTIRFISLTVPTNQSSLACSCRLGRVSVTRSGRRMCKRQRVLPSDARHFYNLNQTDRTETMIRDNQIRNLA